MKKIILSVVAVLVVLAGIGYFWVASTYSGKSYYVKITADGKKEADKSQSGETFYRWSYSLPAYDKDGNQKQMDFTGDHDLKKNAYLDLTYSESKGVTTWKEVAPSDLPAKAAAKLK